MEKTRIDKWLWSVRIFKSRTLAADACKAGKVQVGEKSLKASDSIAVGQVVQVKKEGFNLQFRVKQLIEKRVGAPVAVTCYDNLTPEDEMNKYKDWFIGKSGVETRERGSGRPTKRERREIDEYKDGWFE